MGITKPILEPFTTREIMQLVDHYVENGIVPTLPGHSTDECEHLAKFLGLGYRREWSETETAILMENYPQTGAEETAKLLPYRTSADCAHMAAQLKLKTIQPAKRLAGPEWMGWEIEVLEKYYGVLGGKTAVLLPDRTENACKNKAHKEHISIVQRSNWSSEELQLLQKFYPKIGKDVSLMLPQKSSSEVSRKAASMGISGPHDDWLVHEDEILRVYYPVMGSKVSEKFGGSRSPSACTARANQLGIFYEKAPTKWTEEELAILDANYPTMGTRVSHLLPLRNANTCLKMANQRGLSFTGPKTRCLEKAARWTNEEISILKECFPKLGKSVFSQLPRHTPNACMSKARSLGLVKRQEVAWTDAEKDIIRRNYAVMGHDVVRLLPGRTKYACINQARVLGVCRASTKWTKEDEDILRKFYPIEGAKSFARLPYRSAKACMSRTSRLGLSIRSIHSPLESKCNGD